MKVIIATERETHTHTKSDDKVSNTLREVAVVSGKPKEYS